jgi:hypothetical protein
MSGRIEIHDHLRHHRKPAEVHVQRDPLRTREQLGLRSDLDDVFVLGDRPERRVTRRLDVRHRRLGSQPRPDLVRVPVAGEARRVDQIERVDVDVHRHA